jgi:hypothetical protein
MTSQPYPFDTFGMLSLAIGVLLPNVVGLITKESLNSGLKGFLLSGAAGGTAALTQWRDAVQAHAHLDWRNAVMSGVVTWVLAEMSYQYWWKPSGLSDWLQGKMIADLPADPAGVTVKDILARYSAAAPTAANQTHAQIDQARVAQGRPRLYTPGEPAASDPDDQAVLAGGLT